MNIPNMKSYKKSMLRFWRDVQEILFRLRLYRGIRIPCPTGLCRCTMEKESELSQLYRCEMNAEHPHAHWLLFDCEGAWAIGMYRPHRYRRMYLAFARSADAMIFRLMQED